jgi:hypothetical protein
MCAPQRVHLNPFFVGKDVIWRQLMKRLSLCAISLAAFAACDGDDDAAQSSGKLDAGSRDAAITVDASDAGTPAVDSGSDAGRVPAMFLPAAEYVGLITIDAAFPFGVTQVHKATGPVEPAIWGAHGGPVVTDSAGAAPKVVRYTLPAGATLAATPLSSVVMPPPVDLPAMSFFSFLGVADVSTTRTLFSYTGAGAVSPGELLLLDNTLTVKARAKVNGVYDQKTWARGADTFVAYTGLSDLSAAASTTNVSGLYLAQICGDALLATGACKASFPLLTWDGFSGPVVTDASGNLFVAASFLSKPDAIFAISKAEIGAAIGTGTPLTKTALADGTSGGSSALAAIAPEGAADGWALYRGSEFGSMGAEVATKAVPYSVSATGIKKGTGAELPAAVVKGAMAKDLYYFTDAEGDLWIAVSTAAGGVFVELRRK